MNRLCCTLVPALLSIALSPTPVEARQLDLRTRPEGAKLRNYLASLAQGNEGSADVRALTFDTKDGALNGDVVVRHRHVWGRARNPFTGKTNEIVAYDLTQSAKFGFNWKKKTGHVQIDFGRGAKVNTKQIERLLDGDLTVLAEWVPDPLKHEFRDDYDSIKRSYEERYGKDNVYFASKRFVKWATPETAGKWVLKAVATSGAVAAKEAFREAKREALKELSSLERWLVKKGAREARGVAEALLSGQKDTLPYLAVKWQTVGFFSRKILAGKATPWVRVTHAGFVLIWQPGTSPGAEGPAIPGGNRQAVLALTNTTKSTVAYQMRWTPGERWHSHSLKPGESRRHSTRSLPVPEVKFDSDTGPDKEVVTYNLRYRLFSGKGEPTLSDARRYDFKQQGKVLRLAPR